MKEKSGKAVAEKGVLIESLEILLKDLKTIIKDFPDGKKLLKLIDSQQQFEFNLEEYELNDTQASKQKFIDPNVLVDPNNAKEVIDQQKYVDANISPYARNSIFALWNIAQRTLTLINLGTPKLILRAPKLKEDIEFITTNFKYFNDQTWVPNVINHDSLEMAKALRKYLLAITDEKAKAFAFLPSVAILKDIKTQATDTLKVMLKILNDNLAKYEPMTPEHQKYVNQLRQVKKDHIERSATLLEPFRKFESELASTEYEITSLASLVKNTPEEQLKQIPKLLQKLDALRAKGKVLAENQPEALKKFQDAHTDANGLSLPDSISEYRPKNPDYSPERQKRDEKHYLEHNFNEALDQIRIKTSILENYKRQSKEVEKFSLEHTLENLNTLQEIIQLTETKLRQAIPLEDYVNERTKSLLTDLEEKKRPAEIITPQYPDSSNFSLEELLQLQDELLVYHNKFEDTENFYKKNIQALETEIVHLQSEIEAFSKSDSLPDEANIEEPPSPLMVKQIYTRHVNGLTQLRDELKEEYKALQQVRIPFSARWTSVGEQVKNAKYKVLLKEAAKNIPKLQSTLNEFSLELTSLFSEQQNLESQHTKALVNPSRIEENRTQFENEFKQKKVSVWNEQKRVAEKIEGELKAREEKLTAVSKQYHGLINLKEQIEKNPSYYLVLSDNEKTKLFELIEMDDSTKQKWQDIFSDEQSYTSYYGLNFKVAMSIFSNAIYGKPELSAKESLLQIMQDKITVLANFSFDETTLQSLYSQQTKLSEQRDNLTKEYNTRTKDFVSLMKDNEIKLNHVENRLEENRKKQKVVGKNIKELEEAITNAQLQQVESSFNLLENDVFKTTENVFSIPGYNNENKPENIAAWNNWLEYPSSIEASITKYKEILEQFKKEDYLTRLYTIEDQLRSARNARRAPAYLNAMDKIHNLKDTIKKFEDNIQTKLSIATQSLDQAKQNIEAKEVKTEHEKTHYENRQKLFLKYFADQFPARNLADQQQQRVPEESQIIKSKIGVYLEQRQKKFAVRDFLSSTIAFVFRRHDYKTGTQKRTDFLLDDLYPKFKEYVSTGSEDDYKKLEEKINEGLNKYPSTVKPGDPNYHYTLHHLLTHMQKDIDIEHYQKLRELHQEAEKRPQEKPSFFPEPPSHKHNK